MANIIQIKRSTGTSPPVNLNSGELAYTYGTGAQGDGGDRLYFGEGSNVQSIVGGKYFMDLLDHVHGTATAGSALITHGTSNSLDVLKTGTSASAAGTVHFLEGTNNGTKALILQGAANVGAADKTITLPNATDTLVGKATTDTLTNKSVDLENNTLTGSIAEWNATLQSDSFTTLGGAETITGVKTFSGNPVISEIDSGSTITLDAATDIILNADGGDIFLKDDTATFGSLTNTGGNLIIKSGTTTAATFSGADVTLAGTVGSGAITSTGAVTAGTSFIIGSADINETDLEKLDGITNGTAAANKALVVDTNKDIGTIRNLTIDGVFTDGNYSFDTSGNVTGLGTIGSGAITSTGVIEGTGFTIGSAVINETDLEKLDGITNGTVTANKSIVVDGSKDIATLGTVTLASLKTAQLDVTTNTISTDASNRDIVLNPHGTGEVDVSGAIITGVGTPTGATHAATKGYVDAVKTGLDIKDSVSCATTANLGYTYSNGAGTLTNGSTGAISLDGIALTANMRVLVKNQSTATQNGIYYVSTLGDGSTALVLTRATDADSATEFTGGSFTFVEQGTVAAENGYVFTHDGEPTLGTTSLTVAQFSGAGQVIAGDGLTKSANTVNVVGTADKITVSADAITIASTYAGQNSIVTVGDVTAGEWKSTDVAVPYGGTGVSSFTTKGIIYGQGTGALAVTAAGTWDATTSGMGQILSVNSSGVPTWTNTVDGGTF